MDDRTLLEAAAKAAGFPITWSKDCFGNETGPWIHNSGWRPLSDDGDALRLAVKLRLRVCTPTTDTDCALVSNGNVVAYSEDELEEVTITDLYAATRRAIVRAAAEIGKAMK